MDKDLEHVLEYLNGPHAGLDAWVASEKAQAEYLRLKAIGDRATKIGPLESLGLHVWPGYKEMVDEFQQYQRRKSMQITMQGKYRTRDGRAVRILCVDGPTKDQPVVGIVDGETDIDQWTSDGISFPWPCSIKETIDKYHKFDLVLVPTKHEGWVAIGKDGFVYGQYARSRVDAGGLIDRKVADLLAHVTWED